MADEVNPNNPAPGAVAEVAMTDGTAEGPITIDQFWDRNPLIIPWMEPYLPINRMWKAAMFIACNCFLSVIIICIFSNILLLSEKLLFAPAIILIGFDSYLLATFNTRMARAQRKFIRAKLNERPFAERVRIGVQGIKEWLNP
ncbi:MAG: hypothetical protein E5X34_27835 [Mesorhizobium sp.]|uniref:hypothetical protein n=1 Tax=Mesorhizobium sp. TaxID=1871066 RepID=UPI00121165C7|nr:hypothetical protein [Mesorhizobium sp.]TIR15852.1 MAG: hypothetical protein E5X34_27835 [Mesorhizobium sp.]